MSGVTYFEAIVVGLLQGVTELFPISSLGHSVLLPAFLVMHGWTYAKKEAHDPGRAMRRRRAGHFRPVTF